MKVHVFSRELYSNCLTQLRMALTVRAMLKVQMMKFFHEYVKNINHRRRC